MATMFKVVAFLAVIFAAGFFWGMAVQGFLFNERVGVRIICVPKPFIKEVQV